MEFHNSSYQKILAFSVIIMSKIIQSAYSLIESQKYKKAATLLDSPEVARFPHAKVYIPIFDLSVVFKVLLQCYSWKSSKSERRT